MAEPYQNPGQIDINLGLAGQDEIKALIEGIGTLNSAVRSISSVVQNQVEGSMYENWGDPATGAAERMSPQQAQQALRDASAQAASTGGVILPPGVDRPVAESIDELEKGLGPSVGASMPAEEARSQLGWAARVGENIMQKALPNDWSPAQGGRAPDSRNEAMNAELGVRPSGGGASRPPDVVEGDRSWYQNVVQTGISDPVDMPRFGEFTPQDVLQMVGRIPARRAKSQYEAAREAEIAQAGSVEEADLGSITAGQYSGFLAGAIGRTAAAMPYVTHFGQNMFGFQGATGAFGTSLGSGTMIDRARREGTPMGGMQQVGDVPVVGGLLDQLGLNFNLPGPIRSLTDVLSRGEDSQLYRELRRMREANRYAGVDKNEANAFYDDMIAHGRSRQPDQLAFMRTGYRLMSDEGVRGLDQSVIQDILTQGTQYAGGEGTYQTLENEMMRFRDSAKAARVGLDEMGQQAIEMGNQFQEMGGTFSQGLRFANDFANITGMPAAVGSKLMQDPVVQGVISQRTGVMPQLQAGLPSGSITGGIADTFRMYRGAFAGSNRGGVVNIPGAGQVRTSGSDMDIALAGQQLGLTPEQSQALNRRLPQIEAVGNLQLARDQYRQQLDRATPAGRRRMLTDTDPNNQIVGAREIVNIAGKAGMSKDRQRELQRQFRTDPRKALRNVAKFEKQKGKSISEMLDEQKSTVKVEFTGAAKKFFKEYERKNSDRQKNSRGARAGRHQPNRPHRDADAPANELHPFSAWAEDFSGIGIPESLHQYSGSEGWGELGSDLVDRAEDMSTPKPPTDVTPWDGLAPW